MIIDGHAHSCGNYLNNESINRYLTSAKADYVVLAPGELHSAKSYTMKDKTAENPRKDYINSLKYLIKIVITLTGAVKQIPEGNEYVFELKKGNARVRQFYWITKETLGEIESQYEKMHFDGVKIHQCWVSKKINSKWFEDLTLFLIEKNLPLFIHLGSYKQIGEIIEVQKKHPELKLIIGHCFGIEKFIAQKASLSRNTYFDISNNYFVSKERLIKAIAELGSGRFLLGSDTPYGENSLKLTIDRVNSLPYSLEDRQAILGLNMKKLLGI